MQSVSYAELFRPSETVGYRSSQRTAGDPTGTMDYPIIGGPLGSGGSLFLSEWGWLDNGRDRAATGEIYAETGNIVVAEGEKRLHFKQLVTDAAADPGTLGYRFFPREQAGDAASEFDTGLYAVEHGGLIDIRFSGRSVRMRMEALVDGPWSVGRPRLEIRVGGRR